MIKNSPVWVVILLGALIDENIRIERKVELLVEFMALIHPFLVIVG